MTTRRETRRTRFERGVERRASETTERRIQKATRLNKTANLEVVRDGVDELEDFLDTASRMIDETESYPLYSAPFDLNGLDEEVYNYTVKVHTNMQNALSDWRYMMREMERSQT